MNESKNKQKASSANLLNKCSICGKLANRKFRPFCSLRCAKVDLGYWFSGKYAAPVFVSEDDTFVEGCLDRGDPLSEADKEY